METLNQEAILAFLKQVDAGRWEQTNEVPEGGMLTGLIESNPAPACSFSLRRRDGCASDS